MPFFERLVDVFYDHVEADAGAAVAVPRPGRPRACPRAAAAVPGAVLGRADDVLRRARPPAAAHAPRAVRRSTPRPHDHWLAAIRAALDELDPPPAIRFRFDSYFDMSAEGMRNEVGDRSARGPRHRRGTPRAFRRELISPNRWAARHAVPASRCGSCPTRPTAGRASPSRRGGARRRVRRRRVPAPTGAGRGARRGSGCRAPSRRSGPADRSRRSSTSASTPIGPGFQAEGLVWGPATTAALGPLRGLHPSAHTWRRVRPGRRRRGGVDLLVEAASNPLLTVAPARPQQRPCSPPATRPVYCAAAAPSSACVDADVVGLRDDVRTLDRPAWPARRSTSRAATRSLRRARRACSTRSTLDDVAGTAGRGPRRARRGAVAPGGAVRPPHLRGRPRPHRLGLAVAAPRDRAQVRPHVLQRLRLMDDDPELRFVLLAGRAVRVDARRLPGDVRATSASGSPRAGGSRSAGCGSRPTSTCRRRVAGPPVRPRPALLPRALRRDAAPRCGSPTCSATRRRCRRSSGSAASSGSSPRSCRGTSTNRFPHHTFWWEGIDGSRVLHPLPAGRHATTRSIEPFELAHAERNFADKGRGDPVAACRSASATAAAARTARCWSGSAGCATSRGCRRIEIGVAGGVLRRGRGRVPRRRRCGSASCTSRCTAGTFTRQARTKRATAAASRCCARPSCGAVAAFGGRADDGTRPRRSTASGRRCCSTSSTTSSRARRSAGCTARPRRRTPSSSPSSRRSSTPRCRQVGGRRRPGAGERRAARPRRGRGGRPASAHCGLGAGARVRARWSRSATAVRGAGRSGLMGRAAPGGRRGAAGHPRQRPGARRPSARDGLRRRSLVRPRRRAAR